MCKARVAATSEESSPSFPGETAEGTKEGRRRVKPNAGETELQLKTSNKDTAGNLLTAGDQHGPNTAAQSSVYLRAALKTFNHEKKQELNTNKST